ncbi:MAG: hypothetical protein WD971_05260 [Pirellulales bacterium]
MSDVIQFSSRVGDDGVLNLRVNLGQTEAKREVVVTIAPVAVESVVDTASLNWHEFIERTYGSCEGLGVERHDQGTFEEREPIS